MRPSLILIKQAFGDPSRSPLTERECLILDRIGRDRTHKDIAAELGVSINTVAKLAAKACRKPQRTAPQPRRSPTATRIPGATRASISVRSSSRCVTPTRARVPRRRRDDGPSNEKGRWLWPMT